MILLNINGPINAGKSTVSHLLVKALPNATFIEVDDLLSSQEQDKLGLDFWQGIACRLQRLEERLKLEISQNKHDWIIFAYPMSATNFESWKALEKEGVILKAVTLAPSESLCLTDRGSRKLEESERTRIRQMYAEGYNKPAGSNLVIDNSNQTPDATVAEILGYLGHK